MERALENKSIVLIGGTSGLGLSAAKACLAAGARLVAVGRDDAYLDAARAELGSQALVWAGDAARPETASQAIERARREFGAFDGLYHVAGGSGRKLGDGPLHEISDEGWRGTLDLNLTSVMNSNRAAVRALLAAGRGGSILNLGSVLGHSPEPRHFATHAYAAAKAALLGFTQSCAAYYAPKNIRFNVLAPALVETPMAQRAVNDAAIQAFIRARQPLDGGRVGRASDLDAAVVFFLSDASAFVTGQVLNVDGGWSVS